MQPTPPIKVTPMMAQWAECKQKAEGALLLFRLGDFYEAFEEDAKILAAELDITLTKRQETPMAGIPFHAAEGYLSTLLSRGWRIAIAEQTEEAKPGKGLVKREIVRILSPGTSLREVHDSSNNFFAAVSENGKTFGLAALDLTTGEFRAAEFDSLDPLLSELIALKPTEVLVSKKFETKQGPFMQEIKTLLHPLVTLEEPWRFEFNLASSTLLSHFKTQSLDGFGLKGLQGATEAAGALLGFLKETLSQSVDHVRKIQIWSSGDHLWLDRITQRNLELTESLWNGSKQNTLLETLDHTKTPMGARLLTGWVKQPLLSREKIEMRQGALSALMQLPLHELQALLASVRDLERLTMKISSHLAGPRDLVALKHSLLPLPQIKALLSGTNSPLIQVLEEELLPLYPLVELLERALVPEPPLRLSESSTFKTGYSEELDQLKSISSGSKEWLAEYQNELRSSSGIKTLKVGYTKVSGYYIEVSHGQAGKVPENFKRRQTLTNAERYLTPELKEYEEKILGAEEKIARLEQELFRHLKEQIIPETDAILQNAHALAHLDALQSLTAAAKKWGWKKPEITEGSELILRDGRHPVIEAKGTEPFIPNDTDLDGQKERMMLITGPNMAGKSTYIRQTALIVLMAQMGSFVPVSSAKIGLVDKLFTRIGASDDLARGQSTFMVEMTETANILNNATNRSLVILDEIGRGTSTYDGIAIAWSVAEYLLTEEGRQAKTLFATHFWELVKLEGKNIGAKNYTIAVHESNDEIRFLRKIIPGGTDKSYGIHVARLAGLPDEVIVRSKEILAHLEENANRDRVFEPSKPKKVKKKEAHGDQLMLFS